MDLLVYFNESPEKKIYIYLWKDLLFKVQYLLLFLPRHLEYSWKFWTPTILGFFPPLWGESQIITIWDFWK